MKVLELFNKKTQINDMEQQHSSNSNDITSEQSTKSIEDAATKKRASYISAFFPEPECYSIQYDADETLSYVTPYKQADTITSWMTQLALRHSSQKTINVVIEATGGLGGNLLSFARSKEIDKVVGFEINPKRFEALQHNVQLYKPEAEKIDVQFMNFVDWWFGTQPSSHSSRKELSENPSIQTMAVFIDPPWGGQEYKKAKVIEDLPLYTETNPNSNSKQVYEQQQDGTYCVGMHKLLLDLFEDPKVVLVVLKLPFNFSKRHFSRHFTMDVFEVKKVVYLAFGRQSDRKSSTSWNPHRSRNDFQHSSREQYSRDGRRSRREYEKEQPRGHHQSSSRDKYDEDGSSKRQKSEHH